MERVVGRVVRAGHSADVKGYDGAKAEFWIA